MTPRARDPPRSDSVTAARPARTPACVGRRLSGAGRSCPLRLTVPVRTTVCGPRGLKRPRNTAWNTAPHEPCRDVRDARRDTACGGARARSRRSTVANLVAATRRRLRGPVRPPEDRPSFHAERAAKALPNAGTSGILARRGTTVPICARAKVAPLGRRGVRTYRPSADAGSSLRTRLARGDESKLSRSAPSSIPRTRRRRTTAAAEKASRASLLSP